MVVTLIVETFPTPRATGTASPPREVSRFTSELYPYSVEYPADWQARAGGLSAGSLGGDVFTPTANGRAASINVLSEELSAGDELDVQEYVDLTVQQIEELQGDVVERVGDATVGGYPAVLVRWTDLSRPLQTTTITQAVWVAEGRGWVMTLAAPEELHDRHLPVLEHMLESWRPVA